MRANTSLLLDFLFFLGVVGGGGGVSVLKVMAKLYRVLYKAWSRG